MILQIITFLFSMPTNYFFIKSNFIISFSVKHEPVIERPAVFSHAS